MILLLLILKIKKTDFIVLLFLVLSVPFEPYFEFWSLFYTDSYESITNKHRDSSYFQASHYFQYFHSWWLFFCFKGLPQANRYEDTRYDHLKLQLPPELYCKVVVFLWVVMSSLMKEEIPEFSQTIFWEKYS